MSEKPPSPAARVGDTIAHDPLVPSGVLSPAPTSRGSVIIEGLPAATVGSVAPCSGATSAGPIHPPAPSTVVSGSGTVIIEGAPAARWSPSGDKTTCGASLGDLKLAATRTTFIGD
ncbi:MAG: PAAR domain-containing protein [Myxococcota bacterium]